MAITIETGSGRDPTSNSYASVDGAAVFHSGSIGGDAWDDLDPPDRERALITASRLLDDLIDWKGMPVFPNQPLSWPRRGVRDPTGRIFPANAVPMAVRNATAALALQLASNPDAAAVTGSTSSSTAGEDALKSIALGSLKIEYQSPSSTTTTTTSTAATSTRLIPVGITSMLRHWGNYASGGAVMGRITR